MRFLLWLVFALAVVALPSRASAKDSVKKDRDEPLVLRIELDEEALKIVPTAPQSAPPLQAEPPGLRRARIGVGVSAPFLVGGVIMLGAGLSSCNEPPPPGSLENLGGCAVGYSGAVLAGAGAIGVAISAALLGSRSRKHRSTQSLGPRQPRRVRWDLRSGRMVF